jgi:hypothetical protein
MDRRHPNSTALGTKPGQRLTDADEWDTWIFYRWGWCLLVLGMFGYLLALVRSEAAAEQLAIAAPCVLWWLVLYALGAGLGALITWRIVWIICKSPDAEDPFDGRRWWGLGRRKKQR